ncbi:hypothetical protein SAMD00079811_50310 [Scytonema sp. HK-05]|nr:hypothetical protein SAMD00079811_50310 [Scytonema sp. HK-05]
MHPQNPNNQIAATFFRDLTGLPWRKALRGKLPPQDFAKKAGLFVNKYG